jgi:hypothetical protein
VRTREKEFRKKERVGEEKGSEGEREKEVSEGLCRGPF